MRPRREKSTFFLLAILWTNILGCVWYLVTPDESESTNQNQFDNFDGIDSRGGIQDAHGVDPNLGLVDPDADVVVALPIQDDPDAEDSRQEPDFGIGEQVTFAFTKTIPQDSIFFIENSDREELFGLALCSIESAALHNPNTPVYLLRTTEGTTVWSKALNAVAKEYANVEFKKINADHLVLETPVAYLWQEGKRIERSKNILGHTSDVLRIAILFKFGGTYIDTDIITLQTHPDVSEVPNFVNFEEPGSINGAMMRFRAKHDMLQEIGERLAQYFNPRKWASNGPRLLSIAFAARCDLNPEIFPQSLSIGPDDLCGDIRSYGPEKVFAVHYDDWKQFFQSQHREAVLEAVEASFATHIWGHFFKQEIQWDLMRQDQQAFAQLAAANCPRVYEALSQPQQ